MSICYYHINILYAGSANFAGFFVTADLYNTSCWLSAGPINCCRVMPTKRNSEFWSFSSKPSTWLPLKSYSQICVEFRAWELCFRIIFFFQWEFILLLIVMSEYETEWKLVIRNYSKNSTVVHSRCNLIWKKSNETFVGFELCMSNVLNSSHSVRLFMCNIIVILF